MAGHLSCPPRGLRQVYPPVQAPTFLLQMNRVSVLHFPPRSGSRSRGWNRGNPSSPGLVGCRDTGEPTLALEEGVWFTSP